MNMEEVIKVLELQEDILQFNHFTNEDAWQVGTFLVAEAKKNRLPVTVSIRLNNGLTVFQYAADGTTLENQLWTDKKFNLVKLTERSTLLQYSLLEQNGQTLEDIGLNSQEYHAAGGGFPIRIEEVGVIGSIIVTGMNHILNHDLVVKSIGKYLHIDEVPRIRGTLS